MIKCRSLLNRHIAIARCASGSCILESVKPEAKQFKRWITHEVLPTIRQTGGYVKEQDEEKFIEAYFSDMSEETKKAMILDLHAKNAKYRETIVQQAPHVKFSETVQKTRDLVTMEEMAKLLCTDKQKIGRTRLFELLASKGVLEKRGGIPYQRYIERNYFRVKEYTYCDRYGQMRNGQTTYVTPRGQMWLAKKVPEWMSA